MCTRVDFEEAVGSKAGSLVVYLGGESFDEAVGLQHAAGHW
jgi:hypothetical protein